MIDAHLKTVGIICLGPVLLIIEPGGPGQIGDRRIFLEERLHCRVNQACTVCEVRNLIAWDGARQIWLHVGSGISGQGIALGVAQETRPIISHRAVRVVEIRVADERLGEVTRQLRGGRHIGQ